jgi:hypothetical protein
MARLNDGSSRDVAERCGVGLGEGAIPEEARARAYHADVRQDGPRVEVRLSGAALRRPVFSGRVEPGRVVFDLGRWDANEVFEPSIMEQLPTSRILGVYGSVTAAVSANRLGGALYGDFYIFDTENSWPYIAGCSSESHQFVLSR